MKLTTTLSLKNQENQCQFGIEMELDDELEIGQIKAQTNKAMTALKIAVNEAMNMKPIDNTHLTAKPKQLPTDVASPGQIKYLNDLTSMCGTTLNKWCQAHGVNKNAITAQNCQEWIPELQQRAKGKKPIDDFF